MIFFKRNAYEQKKWDEAKEANAKAFNQGQYFLLALAHALQFSKNPKRIYPKEPLKLNGDKSVKLTQKEYDEIRKIQIQQLEERFNSSKK